jgi:primase-polymerase (primpol)-like protein
MDVLFDNIPDELKALNQWVTWKYNRHMRKLPCSMPTGEVADAHDPASWGTAIAALAAAKKRKHAGIGFDFTSDDPYTGVDLDDCIRDDGTIAPVAAAIIAEANTYTEISPSGKGVKMWFRGRIPESVTSTPIGEGVHTEMYFAGRFFTVTGRRLPGTPATIGDAQSFLTNLFERVKPPAPPCDEQPKALPRVSTDANYIRRWCVAALEGEQQKMKAAGEGERHHRR